MLGKEFNKVVRVMRKAAKSGPVPWVEYDHGTFRARGEGLMVEWRTNPPGGPADAHVVLPDKLPKIRARDDVQITPEVIRVGALTVPVQPVDLDDVPAPLEVEDYQAGVVVPDLGELPLYAASRNEQKPNRNGIFFEASGDTLKALATDGHRLAWREYPARVNSTDPDASFLCPLRAAELVPRGALTLAWGKDGMVLATQDGLRIYTRESKGRFPPYRKVIPQSTAGEARIPGIAEALGCLDKKGSGVILEISPDGVVLIQDDTRIETAGSGDEFRAMFEVRYLCDAVRDGHLEYNGPLDALVVDGQDIVMPMRL